MVKQPEILAPDILDGKVTNGLEESNSWITAIQSVLIYQEEMIVLSQECRLENVHFLGEKDPGIFCNMLNNKVISQGEFITVSNKGRFYVFPQIDTTEGREGMKEYIDKYGYYLNVDKLFLPPRTQKDWNSEIDCEYRKVKILTFKEVHARCMSREINLNKVFLSIELQDKQTGDNMTIYSKLQYLNFSNINTKTAYLQAIHGSVLLGINSNLVHCYTAVAINEFGETHIEFIVPTFDYNDKKVGVINRNYDWVAVKRGSCSFYEYI